MKTCNVLASLLFGSLAAAIPVRQLAARDLVTKTEVVVETVVIFTTVYDNEIPATEATSTPGLFYEKPSSKKPASPPAEPTSIAAPPVAAPPAYTPKPEAPKPSSKAPEPEPTSVYTPPPHPPHAPSPPPAPKPSSVYTPPPAPVAPSQAPPAPVSSQAPVYTAPTVPVKPPTGGSHSGDMTIYEPNGALGACGEKLGNRRMVVALGASGYGESTYDVMTGEATNEWCGKWINISWNGKTAKAQVMDKCPGCMGKYDVDVSPAVWEALGESLDNKTRYSNVEWSEA